MRGDKFVPLKQLLDIIQRLDNLYNKLSSVDAAQGGLLDARLQSLISAFSTLDFASGGRLEGALRDLINRHQLQAIVQGRPIVEIARPGTVYVGLDSGTYWAIIIGSGGGGGGGYSSSGYYAGGGGGSGGGALIAFTLNSYTTVSIAVGRGGRGGMASANGEVGEATTLKLSGADYITCPGGGGGAAGGGTAGGSGGAAGGQCTASGSAITVIFNTGGQEGQAGSGDKNYGLSGCTGLGRILKFSTSWGWYEAGVGAVRCGGKSGFSGNRGEDGESGYVAIGLVP